MVDFLSSKIIEITGFELQKLKVSLQKANQQNWQLAQANSHMLAVSYLYPSIFFFKNFFLPFLARYSDKCRFALQDLNLGKDRVSSLNMFFFSFIRSLVGNFKFETDFTFRFHDCK